MANPNIPHDEIPESENWKTKANEAMREWNRRCYLWKTFANSDLNLIKSYVGLTIFGKPECDQNANGDINFETLFRLYDEKQRNLICGITEQFKFEDDQLRLAHTLLYLSKNDWQVCVFRIMRSTGEVYFIDLEKRVYKSWENFVGENKLPKCEYMAPKDGIHDLVNDEVEIRKTPACSILGTVCDVVACGATVTAVGLSAAAVAEPVAVGLLVGATIHGVRQSVATLMDRSKHGQSVAPDNFESASCYFNIGTSFICNGSTLANLKKLDILKRSGKYSSLATYAIKGVKYTAVATACSNVGLTLFEMRQKYRDNELHWTDLANLCFDLFMVYGAISSVREMRSYFKNLEANKSPPKGLSKGARKRLRKRLAKPNTGLSGNQNMTKVGAWDPEMFNFMIRTTGKMAQNVALQYCPGLDKIDTKVQEIIADCRNFHQGKIKPDDFCIRMIKHGRNLFQLLKDDLGEIKEAVVGFLESIGLVASPESIDDISKIVDDGVIALNHATEESLPEVDSSREDEPLLTDCLFELILELVKHRICRNEVNTTEDLFSQFARELSSVTNEISSKVIREYEDMVSANNRLMGEKKAGIVLSKMGMNWKNDFADTKIRHNIENLKSNDQIDTSFSFQQQLDELCVVYQDVFRNMEDENDVSSIRALKTCEILNNSIELVIQPLLKLFEESKNIYDKNIKHFERKSALTIVLTTLDLDPEGISLNYENHTDTIFIDIAKQKLNLSEIIPHLIPVEESTIDRLNDDPTQFTDDFKIETLLSVCNFYAQRIDSKEMTKVYSFVADKFINQFQSLVNEPKESIADVAEKLKSNVDILSKSDFDKMCLFFCEIDRFETFNELVEIFKGEDFAVELIHEYHAKMDNVTDFHAECLKHLMADDGVTIYTMNIQNSNNIEELKRQATNLFNLNGSDPIEVISESENLVILKHADKYVAFQIIKNETDTLILQIDLSKENE